MRSLRNDLFNLDTIKSFEGLMCNGNGYMSLRASFEFDRSEAPQNEKYMRLPDNVTLEKPRNLFGKWGTFIPGVTGVHPLLKEEMVNLPYFLGWNLYIDGEKISLGSSVVHFFQQLNFDDGSYEYQLSFYHHGELFTIESFRVADIVYKHYYHQEVKIVTESSKVISFESFIDGSVTTNGYNHFVEQNYNFSGNSSILKVCTDTGSIVDIDQVVLTQATPHKKVVENNRISRFYTFEKIGVFQKNTFIKTNRDSVSSNINNYVYDSNLQYSKWSSVWDRIDIQIDGDDRLQDAMRISLYHLYRSKKSHDSTVSIDAKGVAGEGYFGHYFWDTEIYLFPFFLYTDPDAAKELLLFRYHTLKSAQENARTYGYLGAKYPWESSISGKEQCSNWQYSDHEIHVGFDIVYAIWQYYQVTGDSSSMKEYFIDIMLEVSRYIVSRVFLDKDGVYHLKGVMGPDEYLPFTDNNAFTNYMARFSLIKSVEAIRTFGINSADQLDVETFLRVANGLKIPIDYKNQFIWQCDNFDQFEDINFEEFWLDRNQPFGRFISQEKNYRSKALKQADVITLLTLFEEDFDRGFIKNCLEYYLPLTTHDSSLSYTTHSIMFSKLKETESAYEYLSKAVDIDIHKHGAGEGIHIANCGGIYQSIIYGFSGLINPMHTEKLKFRPAMPRHIERIAYKLFYKGKLFAVEIKNNQVKLQEV